MTLLLDRSGLVAGDGITHQGIFDYSLFSSIPNVKIYSPETYSEVEKTLKISLSDDAFDIIRYPKGCEKSYTPRFEMVYDEDDMYYYSSNIDSAKKVIITYGRITSLANDVINELGDDVALIKLVRVFPLGYEKIAKLCLNKELVYVLEESYVYGGVGEKISGALNRVAKKVHIHAIKTLVEHGEIDDLYRVCKFTRDDIISRIKDIC